MNTEVNNLKHIKTNTEEYYIDENGNIQGEYKLYHSNGQLRAICNFVNGRYQGEYREYYSNGQIDTIYNYVDDNVHGEYREYYSDGQIYTIYNYVNGEIHGERKYYHQNGELYEQFFYNMGEEVDVSIHNMDIDNLSQDDINLLMVIYGKQS